LAKLIERGAKAENIVAITFTNKAAKEMGDRVAQIVNLGSLKQNNEATIHDSRFTIHAPFIGTFHSFCARMLKSEAKLVGRSQNYTIFDDDDSMSLLKKVLKAMEISKEQYSPMALHSKISKIKGELLEPEEFDKTAALVFKKYEAELLKNNAFDFDDLIEKTVRIFQRHPKVLEKYQNQFRYVLVDEYQDINTAQYQLIKLLAGKHQNLSVVGDDSQAIYSFRGADFRNFLNFQQDWPKAKIVKLEQNYRSTGAIINAASAVIQNNKLQTPKILWTENALGNPIKVVKTSDPEQEAGFIADAIKQVPSSKFQVPSSKSEPSNCSPPQP
jgi:DNA helicase-2/ATP-dependent DNA helicase PcrA